MSDDSNTAKPTYDEAIEELTGYDELAIEKRFGKHIDDLRLSTSLRALIYISRKRDGLDDKTAYEQAMQLPAKGFEDEFSAPDQAEGAVPDELVSAEGNGDTSGA